MFANNFISLESLCKGMVILPNRNQGAASTIDLSDAIDDGSYDSTTNVYSNTYVNFVVPDAILIGLSRLNITTGIDISSWIHANIKYIPSSEYHLDSPINIVSSIISTWTNSTSSTIASQNISLDLYSTYSIQARLYISNTTAISGIKISIGSTDIYTNDSISNNSEIDINFPYRNTIVDGDTTITITAVGGSGYNNDVKDFAVFDASTYKFILALTGLNTTEINTSLSYLGILSSEEPLGNPSFMDTWVPLHATNIRANDKLTPFMHVPSDLRYDSDKIFPEITVTNTINTGKYIDSDPSSFAGNIYAKSNLSVDLTELLDYFDSIGITDIQTWCDSYLNYFYGTKTLNQVLKIHRLDYDKNGYHDTINILNHRTPILLVKSKVYANSYIDSDALDSYGDCGYTSSSTDYIHTDPYFDNGVNGVLTQSGSTVTRITRIASSPFNHGYNLSVVGNRIRCQWQNQEDHIYVFKLVGMLPVNTNIVLTTTNLGNDSIFKWLSSNEGDGTWKEYTLLIKIKSATVNAGGIFTLSGYTSGTWYLGYCGIFDITDCENLAFTPIWRPTASLVNRTVCSAEGFNSIDSSSSLIVIH